MNKKAISLMIMFECNSIVAMTTNLPRSQLPLLSRGTSITQTIKTHKAKQFPLQTVQSLPSLHGIQRKELISPQEFLYGYVYFPAENEREEIMRYFFMVAETSVGKELMCAIKNQFIPRQDLYE